MRRSPSARQLAALARGRAALAMKRRQSGGARFGPSNLAAARAVRPWSVAPAMCGFRKRTSRCFGRRSGVRNNKKCRISKVSGRCRKTASARRNSPSKRPASKAVLQRRLRSAKRALRAKRSARK